jgi:hypothetical protein
MSGQTIQPPSGGYQATPGYDPSWSEIEQHRGGSPTATHQNPFADAAEIRSISGRAAHHAVRFQGLGARRRTRWKNVSRVFPRWFVTVALVGCILAVLISYDKIAVMSRAEKRQFNAIMTGLSIALGFSISSSLNAMVGNLRWWILSRRYRSRRKVELILQADSMTHLIKMAYKSHRPSIHIAVLFWVLLIIASQIAVASLGFCFSTDTAEKNALLDPGTILLPDMSGIGTGNIISDGSMSLAAQQYAANRYVPSVNGFIHCTAKTCAVMVPSRQHTCLGGRLRRFRLRALYFLPEIHSCSAK